MKNPKKNIIYIPICILILIFAIFKFEFFKKKDLKSKKDQKENIFKIVTTTGIIGDALKNIGGDLIEIVSLMGPGIDPHTYKATPQDLKYLNQAKLIFYNGLHLEGKMGSILKSFNKIKPTFAISDALDYNDIMRDKEFSQGVDPHIWFDVKLWQKVARYLNKILKKYLPNKKDEIDDNTDEYIKKLENLHEYILKSIKKIPYSKRVLITAHDAFGYFGKAYNIRVKGLQGISTTAEYGLKDLRLLVNFIVEKKIKAIFLETSVAEKPIKKVIEDCKNRNHILKLGGIIYSDALGIKGTDEGTYIGMMKKNVDIITKALS